MYRKYVTWGKEAQPTTRGRETEYLLGASNARNEGLCHREIWGKRWRAPRCLGSVGGEQKAEKKRLYSLKKKDLDLGRGQI